MTDVVDKIPVKVGEPSPNQDARNALYQRYAHLIQPNSILSRSLVSFQANKTEPFYNWFRYKEGFSQGLVNYLLKNLMATPGILLDPFAGAGSALFAAQQLGWSAQGIELLPVGAFITQVHKLAETVDPESFRMAVEKVLTQTDFILYYDETFALKHIPITVGAFPVEEEKQLVGYLAFCHQAIIQEDIRTLLLFGAMCVLESISYTRKDGQYLRWDVRSGRSQGKKPFNKGRILPFREAIGARLWQMTRDMGAALSQQQLFADELPEHRNPIALHQNSSLTLLPTLPSQTVDFILTSPPYANRYDYTRTYALELVFLGCTAVQVKQLRQDLLSCTVENKTKRDYLYQMYSDLARPADFDVIEKTFHHQEALQEVLHLLEHYKQAGKLNNNGIARLVHNYFYEMTFAIFELARLLKRGGIIAMVNDNVRYVGEEIPVDLILSDIAASFGLSVRHIWTLERGKGNSSQQMGNHGRTELRKCVYVWEKINE